MYGNSFSNSVQHVPDLEAPDARGLYGRLLTAASVTPGAVIGDRI